MHVVYVHDKHIARQLSSAASECYVCWDGGASTENALLRCGFDPFQIRGGVKETRLQSAGWLALQSCHGGRLHSYGQLRSSIVSHPFPRKQKVSAKTK